MNTIKEKTVFFTGHRKIFAEDKNELLYNLYTTVLHLVEKGYDTFISGGAVGFDTLAAECVIGMKERFPHLKFCLALPCRDQTGRWENIESLAKYKEILGKADEVEYVSDMYTDSCMHERNRLMADNSSVCVAYLREKKGGTAYTCRYAERLGLEIINLAE